MMRNNDEDEQQQLRRHLYELCALLLAVLRSPEPISSHRQTTVSHRRRLGRLTPAGFASLLMGVALALMLCGSVTFMVGFILVPWLLGISMMFYFFAAVSTLSGLGRQLLFTDKTTQGQYFSKVSW